MFRFVFGWWLDLFWLGFEVLCLDLLQNCKFNELDLWFLPWSQGVWDLSSLKKVTLLLSLVISSCFSAFVDCLVFNFHAFVVDVPLCLWMVASLVLIRVWGCVWICCGITSLMSWICGFYHALKVFEIYPLWRE